MANRSPRLVSKSSFAKSETHFFDITVHPKQYHQVSIIVGSLTAARELWGESILWVSGNLTRLPAIRFQFSSTLVTCKIVLTKKISSTDACFPETIDLEEKPSQLAYIKMCLMLPIDNSAFHKHHLLEEFDIVLSTPTSLHTKYLEDAWIHLHYSILLCKLPSTVWSWSMY